MQYTLTGAIDAKLVGDAILWINSQIYNEERSPLRFYISSAGGDIDSAIRLYDFLKALPVEVETVGFGQVDSAALLIFLAGKKRTALKGCRFRVHEATYHDNDTKDALLQYYEDLLSFFRELDRRMKEIVATETKKPIDEIIKLYAKGKIFTAQEAKDYGIVHTIVETLPHKNQSETTS